MSVCLLILNFRVVELTLQFSRSFVLNRSKKRNRQKRQCFSSRRCRLEPGKAEAKKAVLVAVALDVRVEKDPVCVPHIVVLQQNKLKYNLREPKTKSKEQEGAIFNKLYDEEIKKI